MRLELTMPALERLIGGDTEVEIALREQIVQEFARRHLKEVAEKAAYSEAVETVKQHVNTVVKEHFGIDNLVTNHLWPTIDHRLKSMITDLVKEHAHKVVDEVLLKIIEYQKRYWSTEIHRAVGSAVNRQIEKEVEEGIRKRLEAARNLVG